MTTDRDDYFRQTLTGAYGISRTSWNKSETKFIEVYNRLSIAQPLSIDTNANAFKSDLEMEWEVLLQAKAELEYQIEFLHKRCKVLSLGGESCTRQLISLFDEAHSLVGNTIFQIQYERFYEKAIDSVVKINKHALLEGLVLELTSLLESKSRKTGYFLNRDIKLIQEWKTE